MEAQFLTDRGQVRECNEDSGGLFYNQSNQLLAIIADGMGGHSAGDIASEMAVSLLQKKWEQLEQFHAPEQTEKWLSDVLSVINTSIYNYSLQKESYKGMGTTVVVAIAMNEFITIGHVGDSRCYIQNEAGFRQMTEDHSLVNELVRSGEISEEEALVHPRKNIVLKALGTAPEVTPDIKSMTWEVGNKLLLCSDGLTDKLTNDEIGAELNISSQVDSTAKKMVQMANHRGGEDNISVIIVDYYSDVAKEGDESC